MQAEILQQITEDRAWEKFLAHRLLKGRFTWSSFEKADSYVENHDYLGEAQKIAGGIPLGIPNRVVINKIGTDKKRVVYHFETEKMLVLKLIAHLLYRYDDIFSLNCYAFRRKIQAGDAIRRINKTVAGRKLWAYKVDIHDYFNSISIPILLPILEKVLADDLSLYNFFKSLLDDDRAYSNGKIIHEQRGIMAGLPTASFLANVYLMEVDKYFYEAGIIYARYSDDIIIFAEDNDTLCKYRSILLDFFEKYALTVNPTKEHIYEPGEPYEFLGFRCLGYEVDVSQVTRDKMKGKIRRKARAIRRWCVRENKSSEVAIRALIRCFNRKFYDMDDDESLCWSSWFFPVINKTEGLKEIDHYLQGYCRYVATGKHNKSNYNTRYDDLKQLGYRSLVHEYFQKRERQKINAEG